MMGYTQWQISDNWGEATTGTGPVEPDAIPDVQRIRLRPGDVLVLSYDRMLSYPEQERVVEKMKSVFPNNRTLVLGGGITLAVVGDGPL